MSPDQEAIRGLVAAWSVATMNGDLPKLLTLMAEDVTFLVAGQPPMRGKDAFAAAFQTALLHVQMSIASEIQEIQVFSDWAYCWNHLTVTVTPRTNEGPSKRRVGDALSILHKNADGAWVVFRDANMLTLEVTAST